MAQYYNSPICNRLLRVIVLIIIIILACKATFKALRKTSNLKIDFLFR